MRELHPIETQRDRVATDIARGIPVDDTVADLIKTGWSEEESRRLVMSLHEDLLGGRPARVREVTKVLLWAAACFGYGVVMVVERDGIGGPAVFAGIGLGGLGVYRLFKAYEVWRG